jgi:isopenicillin-N epimerase
MPLFDDAAATSTDEMITRLLHAIGSKTRVVGLTWVHSSSGIRLPIREIAAAMRQRDHTLTLVVDGVPQEVDDGVRAVYEISG